VWFNTVLRGDTASIEVGEDSNVQDNSVVHVDEDQPARIGARVTVGHRAIIHGCVIEDECLIGMGAIVLSGARVGGGSLVGAGALVREGQVIPPGSLAVGAPARVVGPVTEAHRAGILNGTKHYVELSRSYLARGFARPHPAPSCDLGITSRARGPMTFLEWGQLLGTIAESPDWVADRLERHGERRFAEPPPGGGWSALEVLCHLRDVDAEISLPRIERLLAEAPPAFEEVDLAGWDAARGYRSQVPAEAFAAWSATRRQLMARLAPLGRAEWARFGIHSLRGPLSLAELVRHKGEHDLSHRRQIAAALGEFA
jgi:carbonic anhydrase/acetyltransferase-like protein (isoleucine patch superfamily)